MATKKPALFLCFAAALLVAVNLSPAGAIKNCTECTCDDPCYLICYIDGGYDFCENYLCSDHPHCCHEIVGTSGNDVLNGTSGHDCIDGKGGNDTIHGYGDGDTLLGDYGDDTLYGDAGGDNGNGGPNDDTLYGGSGYDYLNGGTGGDTCYEGEVTVNCNG